MTVRLTRRVRFEAAHRLVSAEFDDAQNLAIYGKCARVGGHGHNYEVDIVLEGDPDPESGLLISRDELDATLKRVLLNRVDHRNLNDVVDVVTTGENLALVFRAWLEPEFMDRARLVGVVVHETARNRFGVE